MDKSNLRFMWGLIQVILGAIVLGPFVRNYTVYGKCPEHWFMWTTLICSLIFFAKGLNNIDKAIK